MSKKVKCSECANMMSFATPHKVDAGNYEYAKHCLAVATRSCVCGLTVKIKPINHEQYCKHFRKAEFMRSNEAVIEKLKYAIAEYEKQLMK